MGSAKFFEVILGSATSKRLKNTGLETHVQWVMDSIPAVYGMNVSYYIYIEKNKDFQKKKKNLPIANTVECLIAKSIRI